MEIIKNPLDYYTHRISRGEFFSFPGFSDSEFLCMLGERIGEKSGLGQIHTLEMQKPLQSAFALNDETYLRAVPEIIFELPIGEMVKAYIDEKAGNATLYERDMVLDAPAEKAQLAPFIRELRKDDVYIIGPNALRGLFFLKYKKFFEVSTPNFHMEHAGIERITEEILAFNKPGIYLFSCGLSDAVMIHKLHGKIKGAFLIDCGSIWDAFVGVGAQRKWRQELYEDPQKWVSWINSNLRNI